MSMTKMDRALGRFMCRSGLVFENHILSTMELRESKDVPTMATDCRSVVVYNPEFADALSVPEIMGVLTHECYHKAMLHGFRQGARSNARLWNICVDFEANAAVMASRHSEFLLPGTPVGIEEYADLLEGKTQPSENPIHFFDPSMLQMGVETAETLYDRFEESMRENPKPQAGEGEGSELPSLDDIFDGDMDAKLEGEAKAKAKAQGKTETQIKAEIANDVVQAAKRAQKAGNMSAQQELCGRWAGEATVSWTRELRRWTRSHFDKSDWSFARQNRQAITQGLILPTLHSEAAGVIVICADTSGSCLSALEQFCAEIDAVHKRIKPSELYVVYSDTEVCHVDKFLPTDRIKMHPHGGGGTDFRDPFLWVDREGIKPECVLFFSDGYGTFPEKAPRYPVLWAITSDSDVKPPFGRRVTIRV